MITSISLDNVQLDTGGVFCKKFGAPYPDISFSSAVRGGYAGRKITVPRFIYQKIATEWMIIADDYDDLADKREAFAKSIGSVIGNGGATLQIVKSNAVSVEIAVKSAKIAGDITPANTGWCELLVEFETEYPFFLSATEHTEEVSIFQGGGFAVPFALPFSMAAGATSAKIINHLGNTPAYPVFRFSGPLTNPSLINYTSGEVLNIAYTLTSASDVIEVDCYNRTAFYIQAGGSPINIRGSVFGDFFTLKPGNNDIRLGNASYNAVGKCQVIYQDHYLNI